MFFLTTSRRSSRIKKCIKIEEQPTFQRIEKKSLHFISAGKMQPNPRKKNELFPAGEDAFYTAKTSLGVSDGIGMWAETHKIDAGEYSRALVKFVKEFFDKYPSNRNPVDAMVK